MKEKKQISISATGIVAGVILIWLCALTFLTINTSDEQWKCSLVNCTASITGEEWAKDNCFVANNQEVCKLLVDGVNQLIPKDSLNLTAIQQCTEYVCIEETKIRTTNYIINITS